MCDFKPGDEVVCVDDAPQWGVLPCPLKRGSTYVVQDVVKNSSVDGSDFGLLVDVRSAHDSGGWAPSRFRKVQRRDIKAWLATENTVEGPVRPKVDA